MRTFLIIPSNTLGQGHLLTFYRESPQCFDEKILAKPTRLSPLNPSASELLPLLRKSFKEPT